MALPTSKEEYFKRFYENQRVEGFGLDTSMVYPCPFCAAPDWAKNKIIEMEEVMARAHHCGECGRSAKMIFDRSANGVSFEVVQCGGPDQADWFEPKMRRVSDQAL